MRRLKLTQRLEAAQATVAFHFEKPPAFSYRAGQFVELVLTRDSEEETHAFTLASAPCEPDLKIVTRMRESGFKETLKALPLGTEVGADGPYGNFVLHEDASRPAVFLAGGIGITPFRSMLVQAAQDKLPHRLFLFYSNRKPEDAVFLEELQILEKRDPNFTLIATMTDPKAAWEGERGHIRNEMIARHAGNLTRPVYYIAGPPAMARAMRSMLKEAGAGSGDIRVDEFSGY